MIRMGCIRGYVGPAPEVVNTSQLRGFEGKPSRRHRRSYLTAPCHRDLIFDHAAFPALGVECQIAAIHVARDVEEAPAPVAGWDPMPRGGSSKNLLVTARLFLIQLGVDCGVKIRLQQRVTIGYISLRCGLTGALLDRLTFHVYPEERSRAIVSTKAKNGGNRPCLTARRNRLDAVGPQDLPRASLRVTQALRAARVRPWTPGHLPTPRPHNVKWTSRAARVDEFCVRR